MTALVIITFILIGIFLMYLGIKKIKDNPSEGLIISISGFILAAGILLMSTVR